MESKPTPLTADAQRAERFDRNLRSALDDVPVPAGLNDRLLAGCEAALVAPAKTEEKLAPPRVSRRQMFALLATAASLLILVTAGWLTVGRKPRPVTADELAHSSQQWFNQSGPAAIWQTAGSAPVAQFPLDRALAYRPSRWSQLDANTVVYELTRPGQQRALLFVQRTTRPHPTLKTFPFTRLSSSGGLALAAWQRGGVVYVLAVIEGDQRIDDFVKRVPLT